MDDSASMKRADEGRQTRVDAMKQLMSGQGVFYEALSAKFKVRPFKFSGAAERVQDVSELTGTGEQTNVTAALEQAARENAGVPLAGIVPMDDGARNAGGEAAGN